MDDIVLIFQIKPTIQSLIKNANNEVLSNHLNNCVKNAVNEHDADQKIDEVIKLLSKL